MNISQQPNIASMYEAEFRANLSQFANGPVKSRSCRDIPCLIVFLLILAALGGLSYYTYVQNRSH